MESCDFLDLLREQGHLPAVPSAVPQGVIEEVEGTTIMALRYAGGVLVAGDRRATMGNLVVYDRADKVLSIDDDAVMAIAGSPAIAYDIARMLEMSVQYYRRSQLQRLSLDGKLRTLSRLLRQNLPMAMQGIGAVVPIFAAFDEVAEESKIFFYDLLGAEFECVDFCTTGSGSQIIRGALYYQNRWGTPLEEMAEEQAMETVVKMLETAAEYDTATGGFRETARIFPQVMRVSAEGLSAVPEDELAAFYERA
ncbi:MAG: proteasome subunit alpha [Candidatus Latescibacterota bacterium]|nr:proteasome subunit alpha [Candidatus Latescibacterota bacterium]